MSDIYVLTPCNPLFYSFNHWFECKKMYEDNQPLIGDTQLFEDIIEDTFFYSFIEDNKLLGCIYFYKKNNKLFLNAFAGRHHHCQNIKCLKTALSWFNCDIYAKALHKTSVLCLLKCGFKKVNNNIYKYRRI